VISRLDVEVFDQQVGASIDLAGREESPARVQYEVVPAQVLADDDVLAQPLRVVARG
jgi:hypothetical protein